MLVSILYPSLNFLKENYPVIIAIVIALILFYFVYFLTTSSLKKLKTSIFSSYPFDLFFPQGGTWSVTYFILIIAVLGLVIYFMIKGKFYLGPA